jgi:rhodanese-related sulfurtransferase
LTIHEAAQKLRSGEITASELTGAVLERIYAVDNQVKAYLTLTPEAALDQAVQADEVLAGARAADEFDYNHIPGSINIPFEKLLTSYKTVLKKNKTYYIYCDRGKVSNKVVEILIKDGYKAVNVDGGYDKWCQENKIC